VKVFITKNVPQVHFNTQALVFHYKINHKTARKSEILNFLNRDQYENQNKAFKNQHRNKTDYLKVLKLAYKADINTIKVASKVKIAIFENVQTPSFESIRYLVQYHRRRHSPFHSRRNPSPTFSWSLTLENKGIHYNNGQFGQLWDMLLLMSGDI
jgi:hypothetical protein